MKTLNIKALAIIGMLLFSNCIYSQSYTNEVKIIKDEVKKEIIIQIEGAKDDQGLVTLTNHLGEIVLNQEMELNPKTSYFSFSVKKLKAGKYTLRIKSKFETISKELIID